VNKRSENEVCYTMVFRITVTGMNNASTSFSVCVDEQHVLKVKAIILIV